MRNMLKNLFGNRENKIKEEETSITLSYRSMESIYMNIENIENIDNTEDRNELGLTDNQMLAIELDFIEIFKVKLDEIMKAKSSISQ